MSLYPNVVIVINILINIFRKNKLIEDSLINKKKMDMLPINAPKIILFIFTLLFKMYETKKSKIKSKQ